jgi:hypothetical protein
VILLPKKTAMWHGVLKLEERRIKWKRPASGIEPIYQLTF